MFDLKDLEKIIESRAIASAESSYTKSLLAKGAVHCARKMGEEAIELIIAATDDDRPHLVAESADLLYHFLVLLKARGVSLAEVEAELGRRTAQSGHAEKASRPS